MREILKCTPDTSISYHWVTKRNKILCLQQSRPDGGEAHKSFIKEAQKVLQKHPTVHASEMSQSRFHVGVGS